MDRKKFNDDQGIYEAQLNKLIQAFEDDLDVYQEFIEQHLNIYEAPCVNSWSPNKEKITVAEFLKKTRVKMQEGFTLESSKVLMRMVEDLIELLENRVGPVLQKQLVAFDTKNITLQKQKEAMVEEVNRLISEQERIDELEEENKELRKLYNAMAKANIRLKKGETDPPIDEWVDKCEKYIEKVVDLENKEEDEKEVKKKKPRPARIEYRSEHSKI